MKRFILAFLIFVSFVNIYAQTGIPRYHSYFDFLLAPPGALRFGLYGFDNPALLTYVRQPDLLFAFSNQYGGFSQFNRFGVFAGFPRVGFGLIYENFNGKRATDYRIASSFGNRRMSFGYGFGWSTGDRQVKTLATLGILYRPLRYFSVSAFATTSLKRNNSEGVVDLGFRPFGNEFLTLFADYSIQNGEKISNGRWSAGAVVEFIPGIRFVGRYFKGKTFSFGVQISFGRFGVETQQRRLDTTKYSTITFRVGAYDRNVFDKYFNTRKKFVKLELTGPVKYQRYVLFDRGNTLKGILDAIETAKDDPSVGGLVINTSGMIVDRVMLWEIREKLKEFKSAGKRVYVFIDRGGIDYYHFASIGDKVIIDPFGTYLLEGYVAGRTFLKGTFEKLGIGVEELRLFKYKSAVEVYSREKMSEADREQRQKLIEDYYDLAREEICASRNFSHEKFDELVNKNFVFLADEAVKSGLADTIGRWDDVEEIVKKFEGKARKLISPRAIPYRNLPYDNYWGEKPKIAVIYAIGACAMDFGINARRLVKDVEKAVKDPKIKGIVLRVDSPGGDALASDYIAKVLLKAKGKKPVIVSQGYVAASGGYWLSMYGDTIVSAPNTITGSIGVIGSWMYNKGFKEKLGMTTDFVKVGEHADLMFTFQIPILNIGLPDRNLTQEERKEFEKRIEILYREFVNNVSSGRKISYNEVEKVAQGRIWSGIEARKIKLVDVHGGLDKAVRLAMEKSNLRDVDIVEYPKPGLINPALFIPGFETIKFANSLRGQIFELYLKNNGLPLLLPPIDELDYILPVNY